MNSASKVEYDKIQVPAAVTGGTSDGASSSSSASGAYASVSGAAADNGGAPTCGCSWNCEIFFVSDYGEKLLRQHAPGAVESKAQGGGGKGAEAMQTSVVTAPSYSGCCRACRSAKVPLHALCRWIGAGANAGVKGGGGGGGGDVHVGVFMSVGVGVGVSMCRGRKRRRLSAG